MTIRHGGANALARICAHLAMWLVPVAAFADGTGSASVTGYIDGIGPPSDSFEVHFTFQCSGMPTCIGTYQGKIRDSHCSNFFALADALEMTGLDLSRPGTVGGTLVLANANFDDIQNADGTCDIKPGPRGPHTESYTVAWDGTQGAIVINGTSDSGKPYMLTGALKADVAAPPPVFEMVVTSKIDSVQATASAQIQFRPQDVGTSGSVYVFAVAPATLVKNADAAKRVANDPMAAYRWQASGGEKDDIPVQCVLAQLTSTGQLQGVATSALQAYVTDVLSANGQAVTILNGVPTVNIAGATFYVGYGTNAGAMLDNGINRSAVTVPGTRVCQPRPPQTGWWWNDKEGGRGFSIEVRGGNLFFASFLYDDSGRATWLVSPGPASLDGTLYTGTLYSAAGGQTLGGAYNGGPTIRDEGRVTLAFDSQATGTMVWPGGTVPIARQPLIPGSLSVAAAPNQPESGWWWNASESGRGFFMDWQAGKLDIAGYMYDEAGNPVWYITLLDSPDPAGAIGRTVSGSWWSFAGGQTLRGAWKASNLVSNNVAPLSIQFTGPDTALMTLPNGRTTSLTRQRF